MVEVLETYSDPKDTKQRSSAHSLYKPQPEIQSREELDEVLTEPPSTIQRSRSTHSGEMINFVYFHRTSLSIVNVKYFNIILTRIHKQGEKCFRSKSFKTFIFITKFSTVVF